MKKRLRNFQNLNKNLRIIFWSAIISIILIEFIFKRFPEIFPNASTVAKIYLTFCYSYISALIFYFLVVHNPKQKEKEKFYEILDSKLKSIISDHEIIFKQICELNNIETFDFLDREMLRQNLRAVNPHSTFAGVYYYPRTDVSWLKHIYIVSENNKKEINNLFLNSNLMEADLVVILKKFLDNTLFKWIGFFNRNRIINESLEDFEGNFYDYTIKINSIKKYLNNEIHKYLTDNSQ